MEELKPVWSILSQGGLSVIIFIVWYITFTKINNTLAEEYRKHEELSGRLLTLLEAEQEYKSQLVGVLTRLEIELKTNYRCPLTHSGKKETPV